MRHPAPTAGAVGPSVRKGLRWAILPVLCRMPTSSSPPLCSASPAPKPRRSSFDFSQAMHGGVYSAAAARWGIYTGGGPQPFLGGGRVCTGGACTSTSRNLQLLANRRHVCSSAGMLSSMSPARRNTAPLPVLPVTPALPLAAPRSRSAQACGAMEADVDANAAVGDVWPKYVRAGYPLQRSGRKGCKKDNVAAWAGQQ